jgi:hypothetical protein
MRTKDKSKGVERMNRESPKQCGFCAFWMAFSNESDDGFCCINKENNFNVPKNAKELCDKWLDCNVRYSTALKHITDNRTLNWLNTFINQAYLDRVGIKSKGLSE